MQIKTLTIDFAGIFLTILAALLIAGVLPFTALWVGIGLLLAKTDLSLSWSK